MQNRINKWREFELIGKGVFVVFASKWETMEGAAVLRSEWGSAIYIFCACNGPNVGEGVFVWCGFVRC